MSDPTIQQFRYFLEDFEKNLSRMDFLVEQLTDLIDNGHGSYKAMSKMWQHLSDRLEQNE